jgi:hypothetical protein
MDHILKGTAPPNQPGAGDGGLGVMFAAFSIAKSSVVLAAPDLFR